MASDSPAHVTHDLKGVSLPAKKADLVAQARKNRADKQVLADIQAIADGEFSTMADVMKAFGKIHP